LKFRFLRQVLQEPTPKANPAAIVFRVRSIHVYQIARAAT
jgi:hypothetical protein